MFVFSHGFGTDKTDRGLFTDIAEALGVADSCIMVEHNKRKGNITHVPSLKDQAVALRKTLKNIDEPVNLICHSQGCLVAAMSEIKGIQSVLFLAPATSTESFLDKFDGRHEILDDGSVEIKRSDNSTTIVEKKFLEELKEVNPEQLYVDLADTTMLTVIYAQEDAVKGRADMPSLKHKADVNLMQGADHNFSGDSRQRLVSLFKALKDA